MLKSMAHKITSSPSQLQKKKRHSQLSITLRLPREHEDSVEVGGQSSVVVVSGEVQSNGASEVLSNVLEDEEDSKVMTTAVVVAGEVEDVSATGMTSLSGIGMPQFKLNRIGVYSRRLILRVLPS
jgi:hypothetical protein